MTGHSIKSMMAAALLMALALAVPASAQEESIIEVGQVGSDQLEEITLVKKERENNPSELVLKLEKAEPVELIVSTETAELIAPVKKKDIDESVAPVKKKDLDESVAPVEKKELVELVVQQESKASLELVVPTDSAELIVPVTPAAPIEPVTSSGSDTSGGLLTSSGSDTSGGLLTSSGSDTSGDLLTSSGSDTSGGLLTSSGSDTSGGLLTSSGSDTSGGLLMSSGSDTSGGLLTSSGSDTAGGLLTSSGAGTLTEQSPPVVSCEITDTSATATSADSTSAKNGAVKAEIEFTGDKAAVILLFKGSEKITGQDIAAQEGKTEHAGSVTFTGLAPGHYTVKYYIKGEGIDNPRKTRNVTVGVPIRATASASGGSISVTITDAVPGEDIIVYGEFVSEADSEGNTVHSESLSDEKTARLGDTVTLSGRGAGKYNLAAEYYNLTKGMWEGSVTIESAPVDPSVTYSQIKAEIKEISSGVITVTITEAAQGQDILVYSEGLSAQGSTTVQKGGTVTFTAARPGTYTIGAKYENSGDGALHENFTVAGAASGGESQEESRITSFEMDKQDTPAGKSEGSIGGAVSFIGKKNLIVTLLRGGEKIGEKELEPEIGTFLFENLSGGDYELRLTFKGDSAPAHAVGPYISEVQQQAKAISAAATAGENRIDVTVSDASALPITVVLTKGSDTVGTQTIAAGVGSVSFTGLGAGTYGVSINYDPAQAGVSAVVKNDLVVTEKAAGITITDVQGGVNQLTVTGTAQAGAQIMLTTEPAAQATVYAMAGSNGSFTVVISCAAGTYTKVTAQYSGDTASAVSKSGSFVVTAPAVKPSLSVDAIDASSTTVSGKTTPGVVVKLTTSDYEQTVIADAQGIVRFSLPHTYAKGTTITFTIYYGTNNEKTDVAAVQVTEAPYYGKLKKGDKGDAVKKLTQRLKELGYPVSVTSKFDSSVERAVLLFQEANGLDADGEADRSTQARLFSVGAIRYNEKRYPTLVRGDRGLSLIYTLQQRLKDLGYYTIKVDGIFGSGTQRAVRDFQANNGLTVTGKADDATQRLLYSSSARPAYSPGSGSYKTLSRSSKYQSAVVPLQRRLKALGYYSGNIDGYFGSGTYRAVYNFQKRNDLSRTGVADPYTQKVLYSSSAKAASSSSSSSSSSTGYRLLYWGCEGSAVKKLQNALINAGYKSYVRTADGIYGQWTYDAVRAYQRDHGLAVDGIAGKKTQNSLYGTNY